MTGTLAPMLAIIGLSGGELILIFLVLMVPVIISVLVISLYFLLKNKKTETTRPPAFRPAPQPVPAVRKCAKCGATLRPDAPEGLCPACLLQHGIATEG